MSRCPPPPELVGVSPFEIGDSLQSQLFGLDSQLLEETLQYTNTQMAFGYISSGLYLLVFYFFTKVKVVCTNSLGSNRMELFSCQ